MGPGIIPILKIFPAQPRPPQTEFCLNSNLPKKFSGSTQSKPNIVLPRTGSGRKNIRRGQDPAGKCTGTRTRSIQPFSQKKPGGCRRSPPFCATIQIHDSKKVPWSFQYIFQRNTQQARPGFQGHGDAPFQLPAFPGENKGHPHHLSKIF